MSQAKVKCTCCNGEGHRELRKNLVTTLKAAVRLTEEVGNFTSFELAQAAALEHSNAHHRIQRMIKLGLIRRVPKVTPARYVTV